MTDEALWDFWQAKASKLATSNDALRSEITRLQAELEEIAIPAAIVRDRARKGAMEEAANVADDYALDALEGSEYRLACADLSETFRALAKRGEV